MTAEIIQFPNKQQGALAPDQPYFVPLTGSQIYVCAQAAIRQRMRLEEELKAPNCEHRATKVATVEVLEQAIDILTKM